MIAFTICSGVGPCSDSWTFPLTRVGVVAPIGSPESGPVDDLLRVLVSNPLDATIRVVVRGVPNRGAWTFDPPEVTLLLGPGERRTVGLGIRSRQVAPGTLVPPQVEVQFDYEDSKGRTVPLVIPRRVPLRRTVSTTLRRQPISVDGRASGDRT